MKIADGAVKQDPQRKATVPEPTWIDDGHLVVVHDDDRMEFACTTPDQCTLKLGCEECDGRGWLIDDDEDGRDDSCRECRGKGLHKPVLCWLTNAADPVRIAEEEAESRRTGPEAACPPSPGRYVLEHYRNGSGEDAELCVRFVAAPAAA